MLATTGIALSVASGWTTWDGIRNFTREPVLSLLITFGIQGVMLVVAWLIGESFATSSGSQNGSGQRNRAFRAMTAVLMLLALLAVLGIFILDRYLSVQIDWSSLPIFIGAISLIAILLFVGGAEVFEPLLANTRVIMKNIVLWVMFLACMATSVFFSFDSLFATIFASKERTRAAELGAHRKITVLINDIGAELKRQRSKEAGRLLQGTAWQTYDTGLDTFALQVDKSSLKVQDEYRKKIEKHGLAIAEQKERLSTLQSEQSGLRDSKRKASDSLTKLQTTRGNVASEVAQLQKTSEDLERQLESQIIALAAEEKGVEGTGKAGRGPAWRSAKAAKENTEAKIQIAKQRLRGPQERLLVLDKKIEIKRTGLSGLSKSLAGLRGKITATQRLTTAMGQTTQNEDQNLPKLPAQLLASLEQARDDFRKHPTEALLINIGERCRRLSKDLDALNNTNWNKDKPNCDLDDIAGAGTTLFQMNMGLAEFQKDCSPSKSASYNKTTDELYRFARNCLAISRLPSKVSEKLSEDISQSELNRDDLAHRFVVTWNAFEGGNRLAYLALAIAIAIDVLVFMSGLFGANAIRSPLQDIPSVKARSAQQLEQIIENALLPDRFSAARMTLEAMHPIDMIDGHTQQVIPSQIHSVDQLIINKVLNAGAAIGAVSQDPNSDIERFLVRPELFEFLTIFTKRDVDANREFIELSELEQTIIAALQPDLIENAKIVLRNLVPLHKKEGNFSSALHLSRLSREEQPVVNNVLNAAAYLEFVKQNQEAADADIYLIDGRLHKILLRLATPQDKLVEKSKEKHTDGPPQVTNDLSVPHLTAPENTLAKASRLKRQQQKVPEQVNYESEQLIALFAQQMAWLSVIK